MFVDGGPRLVGGPGPRLFVGGPSYGLAGRPPVPPRTQSMDLNFRQTWRREIALQLLPAEDWAGIPPRLDGVGKNGHFERI